MLLQPERRQLLRQRPVSKHHQAGVLLHSGGWLGGQLRDPCLPRPWKRCRQVSVQRIRINGELSVMFDQRIYNKFYFVDDYNKLCPHASGLLPLPASSLGEQRPFIGSHACIHSDLMHAAFGALIQTHSLLAHVCIFILLGYKSPSPPSQMQTSARCSDRRFARTDSVPISSLRTPATAAVASTTTTSALSVSVRNLNQFFEKLKNYR